MQEPKLFEYAVIRLVPRAEREEFLNVGLIIFSKKEKYIRAEISLSNEKLRLLPSETSPQAIANHLESFVNTASGKTATGAVAKMDIPERFRWLTAVKSSIIQTSRPHPGISQDLDKTFIRMFQELVL